MDWRDYIVATPGTRSGLPRIDGTRIAVDDVMEMVEAGMSPEEIVADFPQLSADQIAACVAYRREFEAKTVHAVAR